MSKITIVGSGNVGSLTALRIVEANLADVVMIDISKDIPEGKALDMEDAAWLMHHNRRVCGEDSYENISDSDIIIITAGFARKPGMTREDLVNKNSQIIKDISARLKDCSSDTIIVVVTNPVDVMTYLVKKFTNIDVNRIFGMGISLDTSRFANLIRQELKCSLSEIEPVVIGSHGKTMLPLPRLTYVKGKSLNKLLPKDKVDLLIEMTKQRGAQIVDKLKNGSAFFAPSAALFEICKAILLDEKRTIGVSAFLNGEYGIKDICVGVPVVLGRAGIEKIVELDLDSAEKKSFNVSTEEIKQCMISV